MTPRSLTQYKTSTHESSNNVRFNFVYRPGSHLHVVCNDLVQSGARPSTSSAAPIWWSR